MVGIDTKSVVTGHRLMEYAWVVLGIRDVEESSHMMGSPWPTFVLNLTVPVSISVEWPVDTFIYAEWDVSEELDRFAQLGLASGPAGGMCFCHCGTFR